MKPRYAKFEITILLEEIDDAVIEPVNLTSEIRQSLENVGFRSTEAKFIGEVNER